MKKLEAKFQTIFNKYIRESGIRGYFELKQTNIESMPWGEVKPHQLAGLLAAEQNGLVWKLSDEDQRRKPFDSFSTRPEKAYVVVKFPWVFYMIRATTFLLERNRPNSGPSLTKEYAHKIAERVIHTDER